MCMSGRGRGAHSAPSSRVNDLSFGWRCMSGSSPAIPILSRQPAEPVSSWLSPASWVPMELSASCSLPCQSQRQSGCKAKSRAAHGRPLCQAYLLQTSVIKPFPGWFPCLFMVLPAVLIPTCVAAPRPRHSSHGTKEGQPHCCCGADEGLAPILALAVLCPSRRAYCGLHFTSKTRACPGKVEREGHGPFPGLLLPSLLESADRALARTGKLGPVHQPLLAPGESQDPGAAVATGV